MLRLGILISGSGTNLQAIIDSIEAGRLNAGVAVVISDRPGAYGIERAKKHNIQALVIDRALYNGKEPFEESLIKTLKEKEVGLVVCAGFMRLFSPLFVKAFPMRIMNIHPSLLPAFSGLNTHKNVIAYGARFSGCTAHFVDEGLDTGPIIIQAAVPVMEGDTPETLAQRIHIEEHRIYPQAIRLFADGKLKIIGRRVIIKDHPFADSALENPKVTI
ncbi:MAG: phosphoribosylglycinamide formyltransferase [Deltaproteobacteria bacterium]|nr:phosphoribosylglycinamide formyltransferase [Deltaproteobacteria bacterium]